VSDGYVSIVSGLSLARPYNGIKRMRRRSEKLIASPRQASLQRLFFQRGLDARRTPRETYAFAGVAGFAGAVAYFLRNLSTRPPVSTIFCLPV
jgi:hypothetical protein